MEDNGYIIGAVICNKLKELIPDFAPHGVDRRLLDTAKVDFNNYLRVKWDDILSKHIGDKDELLAEAITEWLTVYEDAKEEIDAWVSLWLGKWKQRVQILFGTEPIYNKTFNQVQDVVKRSENMSYQEEKRFKEPVIFALIRHGELVCTDIMAQTIIRRVYTRSTSSIRSIEGKLQFLNACMNEVRDMALQTSNKLIFISLKDFKW